MSAWAWAWLIDGVLFALALWWLLSNLLPCGLTGLSALVGAC